MTADAPEFLSSPSTGGAQRQGGPGSVSRVLHVHTLPVISGSGINTLLTMIGSKRCGHHVALACESSGRLTDEAEKAGIEVFKVPSMGREVHPLKDPLAVIALARLMRAQHFDVVHTHNSKAGFVGRLAARLARVPVIVHTVHGFAFHDAESAARRLLFRVFERVAANWSDGIIFISRPLEQWADRERIARNVPRRIIYSGIDAAAFRSADGSAIRREFNLGARREVVGIISKLWEGKGHHVLFQAWRKVLQSWTAGAPPMLLVVGEGPLDSELRELADRLKIQSSVVFTGFRTDIPEITAAIDIAVLPSAFEGMGRVVLEAMAAGKPVVASRVGGIPDLVQDGVNGLLVPPNDVDSLAAALRDLLQNAGRRQKFAARARASVEEKHSAAAMIEQIHSFYAFLKDRKYSKTLR